MHKIAEKRRRFGYRLRSMCHELRRVQALGAEPAIEGFVTEIRRPDLSLIEVGPFQAQDAVLEASGHTIDTSWRRARSARRIQSKGMQNYLGHAG
jgi:hypothetical protein